MPGFNCACLSSELTQVDGCPPMPRLLRLCSPVPACAAGPCGQLARHPVCRAPLSGGGSRGSQERALSSRRRACLAQAKSAVGWPLTITTGLGALAQMTAGSGATLDAEDVLRARCAAARVTYIGIGESGYRTEASSAIPATRESWRKKRHKALAAACKRAEACAAEQSDAAAAAPPEQSAADAAGAPPEPWEFESRMAAPLRERLRLCASSEDRAGESLAVAEETRMRRAAQRRENASM